MRSASSQPRPEKVGCVTFGDKRTFASRTHRPLSSRLRNPDQADTQQQVEALPRQALGLPQRRDHALTQGVGHGEGRAIAAEHKRHIDASVHVDDRSDTGHADGVDLLVGARFDRLRRADHIGDDDPPVTRNLCVPGGLDGLGKGLQHRKIAVEIDRRHERVGLRHSAARCCKHRRAPAGRDASRQRTFRRVSALGISGRLSSPLSSRARRSSPHRRHSAPLARTRSATYGLRRGSPCR